jgi:hypothetical protein
LPIFLSLGDFLIVSLYFFHLVLFSSFAVVGEFTVKIVSAS